MEAAAPPQADHILAEVEIDAPPASVWSAIRDPAKIHRWFGWEAATLEEEIDFIFTKSVDADEQDHILRFVGMPDRFEVKATGSGSRLTVIRTTAEEIGRGYDGMIEGWISFVHQLRLAIERHDLAPRRTLYLSGDARPGGGGPVERLGLGRFLDAVPGLPARIDLPGGETANGELWHRSEWQIGITIPQWGEGLLLVSDMSATEKAPDGRGMLILTTYGLSDPEYDELERDWKQWWDSRFRSGTDPIC